MADTFEDEIARLRVQNTCLAEDLAQVQSDKEFVWSLWKRLQGANPDISQAINLVVAREKEKSEVKDKKVLQILQMKDEKIKELDRKYTREAADNEAWQKSKMELKDQLVQMEVDLSEEKKKTDEFQDKIRCYANKEKTVDSLHRQLVEDFEKEKIGLINQCTHLRSENSLLKTENADLGAIKIVHESKVKMLNRDMADWKEKFNLINCELEDMKVKVMEFEKYENNESEAARLKQELDELWDAHKQCKSHSEEQALVITQLQRLQKDTQKMMKNQDLAHHLEAKTFRTMFDEIEKKYRSVLTLEAELRSEIMQMRQLLLAKDERIHELELNTPRSTGTQIESLDEAIQVSEMERVHELRIQNLQDELEIAKNRLKERNRQLRILQSGKDLEVDFSSTHLIENCSTPTKQSPRSRSLSPKRYSPEKVNNLQKKLNSANQLLRLKNREVEELRTTHDKRLERLKSLQNDHKLLKEEYKTLQEEINGKRKRSKPLQRSQPKELQRENTDAVWNELAFFRNENNGYKIERSAMQEELDNLRVQATTDAATIHELRVGIEQEKEECTYLRQENLRLLKPQDHAVERLENTQAQLKNKEHSLEELHDQNSNLMKENDRLSTERRVLKAEMNVCRQEVAEKRMELANIKRDLYRVQRELMLLRHKRTKKIAKKRRPLHRQYKEVLDKAHARDERLHYEDDWEEISESESDSEELSSQTETTTSLGGDIVRVARTASNDDVAEISSPSKTAQMSNRQIESIDDHIKRMALKDEVPVKDIDTPVQNKDARKVIRLHDMATSPIASHYIFTSRKTQSSIRNKQLSALKQRLGGLHQQVQVLRQAKSNLNKDNNQLKTSHEKITAELQSSNLRLKSSRQQVQKLSMEVDRLQQQKALLEQRLNDSDGRPSTPSTVDNRQSDLDWKNLENRLRISAAEVARLSNQNKSLKQDVDTKELQMKTHQERMNRLERDVSQKRILLEDTKLKLKLVQSNVDADTANKEELEHRLKSMQDIHDRQRTTIESMKQRLAVISKERHEYEALYRKHKEDCVKKVKLLQDSDTRVADLEVMIAEIEQTAQQQLRALAKRSEVAIDTANEKFSITQDKLESFNDFLSNLAQVLLRATQHARTLARQRFLEQRRVQREEHRRALKLQRRNERPRYTVADGSAMESAQRVARSILNISQSELDDIMSADVDDDDEDDDDDGDDDIELVKKTDLDLEVYRKRDKRWVKRWEKISSEGSSFALPLVDCMMEMIDERIQLLTKA